MKRKVQLERDTNPYRTPEAESKTTSLRKRIRIFLSMVFPSVRSSFAAGEAVLCNGIAFYIDPDEDAVFYAASPSSAPGEAGLDLVVAEAMRMLPGLLAEYPQLTSFVANRKLCVRLVEDYANLDPISGRERVLDQDAVSRLLQGEEPSVG